MEPNSDSTLNTGIGTNPIETASVPSRAASPGIWYSASIAFFASGWFLSAWLLVGALAKSGKHLPVASTLLPQALCPSCNSALGSASAWQLGVPLGAWGLLYFAAAGLLIMVASAIAIRAAYLLVAIGAGVSLVLLGAVFTAPRLCVLCLLVHLANLGLLAALWIGLASQAASTSTRMFRSRRLTSAIAAFAIVTGVFAEIALWSPTANARQVAAQFNAAPRVAIPIRSADPVLGPANAPIQMVVFSSFQCPACKQFAEMIHHLHEQYPNELAIVFKNFPLDTGCNPSLKQQMQPRACDTAFAAEAAKAQGNFWQYHDLVFASTLRETDDDLRSFANHAGVNMQRWDEERKSDAAKAVVKEDVAEGMKLNLNGTPSIFLDGRYLSNFSYPTLVSLVQQEIDAAPAHH